MRRMPLDPTKLTFRAMTADDIPHLRRWLAEPHVSRWFTPDHADWLAATVVDPIPAHPHIVSYDAQPIGLIIWEYLSDFPEVAELYGVTDNCTINCDVFIGEPQFIHQGLGAPMIKRFLKDLTTRESRITRCVIDPHLENKAAIRAYEKAGFRWIRNAPDGSGETVYLMELLIEGY